MTDKDGYGQTYGEAADELQEELGEAVKALEDEAANLRDEGGVVNRLVASYYEYQAAVLGASNMSLAEKRRRMPFGLESAQGFGETMANPTITAVENMQREGVAMTNEEAGMKGELNELLPDGAKIGHEGEYNEEFGKSDHTDKWYANVEFPDGHLDADTVDRMREAEWRIETAYRYGDKCLIVRFEKPE